MADQEAEIEVIDNRVDPLAAVHLFGQLSVVMMTAWPLLWRYYLMSNTSNSGFKLAAYLNFYFSMPYAFIYALFNAFGESRFFANALDITMRLSIANGWFLNFFALYFAVVSPTIDSTYKATANYPALAGYFAYSFVTMFFQYRSAPGVVRYK